MFRHALAAVLCFHTVVIACAAAAAEPLVVEGKVSAVTVYQGQALVTRELDLPQAQGLLEVVVTNLPENALPGSLFAEPSEWGASPLRAVPRRPIEDDVRKEVRELDEQIQAVQDQLAAIAAERSLLENRKAYLSQLEQFSAVTSRQELKSGVLNSETLKDLTQFVFDQRDAISKRELELAQQERAHNAERDLLKRKRDTIASGSSRTVREAVVFINAPQAGAAKLRLSYLVSNASWSPSYNVRAADDSDQITLEYNASIQQMSGEDWSDVEMTLSTATPSLVAGAPKLDPLTIKLAAARPPMEQAEARPATPALRYRQVQEDLKQLGKLRNAQVYAAEKDFRGKQGAAAQLMNPVRCPIYSVPPRPLLRIANGSVGSWSLEAAGTAQADKGAQQLRLRAATARLQ